MWGKKEVNPHFIRPLHPQSNIGEPYGMRLYGLEWCGKAYRG